MAIGGAGFFTRIPTFEWLIASNDNWKDAPIESRPAATLAPADDREAAIALLLHGGTFTAIVRGANNSTGTALVEVYHLQ